MNTTITPIRTSPGGALLRFYFISLALAIGCFLLLPPKAFGVVPPPDGGYPGGNTAEGQNALFSLTTGGFNTAVGFFSLRNNTDASFNTAIGAGTLLANTAGNNTAIGAGTLLSNTAPGNTAIGAFALLNNSTGNFNTAIGQQALFGNTTGSENIALGASAGGSISTAHNVICIGHPGDNVSNSCFIGHIRNVTTVNSAIPVVIATDGQLGTMSSSKRVKKEIKPMDKASESILALKPITFRYKSDKTNTPQFGLVAEEVAEVNRDLVVRDENGEVYTVRYDQVNAMLLNEFLKEHRKVLELEANAARQQKQVEALAAGLQRVTAQLQLIKPVPHTASID
jgi:Chaperone of endosialidase